jgi:hypothetical protein
MKTNHAAIMACLHKLPAAQTENGEFWICKQKPSCHFVCGKDARYIYENGVIAFHKTEQPQPVCCDNNLGKLFVVKDIVKDNYGRPFFKCSKNTNKCDYFEWADKIIPQKPRCYHNEVSKKRRVTKSGPNKERRFFSCPKHKYNALQCNFFQWEDETQPPTEKETPPPVKEKTQPPNKKRNTTPKNQANDDDDDDIPLSQSRFPRRKKQKILSDEEEEEEEKKPSPFLFYTRGHSGWN